MRGSDADDLYDEWLDAALAGDVRDPERFGEGREGDPAAMAQCREWLRPLHRDLLAATAARTAQDASLPAGRRLGDFVLEELLGSGGMGQVWRARQESLDRVVALKVVRGELLGSATAALRFEREAKALAAVRHPHVVTVHGSGVTDGVHWLAMDLVAGRSLQEALATRPPVLTIVRWGRQVATALGAVHQAGLVHRDVKPDNVRIDAAGNAVLVDFGLARTLDAERARLTWGFAGSPAYAAPEQLAGDDDIDGRADVYALGAVLCEGLSGAVPHAATSVERLLQRIRRRGPPRLRARNAQVSVDLERVVQKALAAEPADRYPTANAFADDLQALLELRPVSALPLPWPRACWRWLRRHPGPVAAGALALLLLLLAALWAEWWERRAATELVATAQGGLQALGQVRADWEKVRWQVVGLEDRQRHEFLPEVDERRLLAGRRRLHELERDREKGYAAVADAAAQAARLWPGQPDLPAVQAGLWWQRWLDVRGRGTPVADLFRDLMVRADPDGSFQQRLAGERQFSLSAEPPADAFLFRYLPRADLSGAPADCDPVLDPVPWGGRRPPTPAGTLLEPSPAAAVGRTPLPPLPLPPGAYVVLLRAPGHEDLRVPFHIDHAFEHYSHDQALRATLLPAGRTPAGFVRVASESYPWPEPGFWIQRAEVTNAAWLAFVNDPAVLRERLAGEGPPLVPRAEDGTLRWPVAADGTCALPADEPPDWPVRGISWHDAERYVAHRNERDAAMLAGRRHALPTFQQWSRAAHGGDSRRLPWGDVFWARACRSRFATREPGPAPAGSHPADTSPFGVQDLAGNVAEWCRDADPGGRRLRAGGSFLDADPALFATEAPRWLAADAVDAGTGLRLVLEPGPPPLPARGGAR